jgi:hypothetical protein
MTDKHYKKHCYIAFAIRNGEAGKSCFTMLLQGLHINNILCK